MSECEHVHEWILKAYLYVGIPVFVCNHDDCDATLSVKQVETMINEHAALKREIKLLKKEAEPFRAQIDQRKTYHEPDTRPTPRPPDEYIVSS